MRCFYHPDREAVGICANCHRGLCAESAADIDAGMACRGRCEEQVLGLHSMVTAARPIQAGLMPVGMGLLFCAIGVALVARSDGEVVSILILALGLFMLGAGVRSYLLVRRAYDREKRPFSP
jgi:hypothetical protein